MLVHIDVSHTKRWQVGLQEAVSYEAKLQTHLVCPTIQEVRGKHSFEKISLHLIGVRGNRQQRLNPQKVSSFISFIQQSFTVSWQPGLSISPLLRSKLGTLRHILCSLYFCKWFSGQVISLMSHSFWDALSHFTESMAVQKATAIYLFHLS